MCFGRSVYIPLLTERETWGVGDYRHVAPPEQEPSITNDDDFSGKALQLLLVRAVARNRSFRSGNFFIRSMTSSFVSFARRGRLTVFIVFVLSFFMRCLSIEAIG